MQGTRCAEARVARHDGIVAVCEKTRERVHSSVAVRRERRRRRGSRRCRGGKPERAGHVSRRHVQDVDHCKSDVVLLEHRLSVYVCASVAHANFRLHVLSRDWDLATGCVRQSRPNAAALPSPLRRRHRQLESPLHPLVKALELTSLLRGFCRGCACGVSSRGGLDFDERHRVVSPFGCGRGARVCVVLSTQSCVEPDVKFEAALSFFS